LNSYHGSRFTFSRSTILLRLTSSSRPSPILQCGSWWGFMKDFSSLTPPTKFLRESLFKIPESEKSTDDFPQNFDHPRPGKSAKCGRESAILERRPPATARRTPRAPPDFRKFGSGWGSMKTSSLKRSSPARIMGPPALKRLRCVFAPTYLSRISTARPYESQNFGRGSVTGAGS
jgi:hypothetical protein